MQKTTDAAVDWDLYRYFFAVVESGSLSAAARQLLSTQSTVSRQIARLERQLGVSLFTRSPEGLLPTSAALRLREPAQAMANAVAALARGAQAGAERSVVRITVPEVVGVEVLTPLLARYQQAHAGLQLELSIAEQNEDLLRREADIAVRMAAPQQAALLARRLGSSRVSLYAHRDYLARHGMPQSSAELAQHRIIGYDRNLALHAQWLAQGFPLAAQELAFRSDCGMARMAALRAGMGIGLCHAALALREPSLLALPVELFAWQLDVWVVMHEDQRQNQELMDLFAYLAEQLPLSLQLLRSA
jgi:DNA-binding transcriptional LysR family regulator